MVGWKAKLERVDMCPIEASASDVAGALRARIAHILAKAPAAPPPRVDPAIGELPFVREEGPLGPLHVRRLRLSAAHHVGRTGVGAAVDAQAAMLGLLALDPALASCEPARALYLDTETTRLSGDTGTVPFLIGLAWFEQGSASLIVEQLFLRQPGEEAPMLERLAEHVRRASMLVSYNGKSFNLPLLRARMSTNRLEPLAEPPHLDLLPVARRLHRRRIGTCNLSRVESHVLGFARLDDVSSAHIGSCYTRFLRTGDEGALPAVVRHNEWDVVAMAALVGLYGEPLSSLLPVDLAGAARSLRRAGSLELADTFAQTAVERGGGAEAVRARGEVAKARGDKARALADYASLLDRVDDPALHLELAKLYEHHARAPLAALAMIERGTGEGTEASKKRVGRLRAKLAKRSNR